MHSFQVLRAPRLCEESRSEICCQTLAKCENLFVDSDLILMLRKAGDAPGRKTVGLVLGLLSIKTL